MPNIKSAKKRVRIINRKTLKNKIAKTRIKTAIKAAVLAVNEKKDGYVETVRFAIKKLDQAGSKGIFHKNKVAHKKSQLQKLLNSCESKNVS